MDRGNADGELGIALLQAGAEKLNKKYDKRSRLDFLTVKNSDSADVFFSLSIVFAIFGLIFWGLDFGLLSAVLFVPVAILIFLRARTRHRVEKNREVQYQKFQMSKISTADKLMENK